MRNSHEMSEIARVSKFEIDFSLKRRNEAFSFKTTYLRRLVSLIPPLLPAGLCPSGALFNGRSFPKKTP